MHADDSPAIVVARFLRTNNYTQTLDAFIAEAGLPIDAGSSSQNSLTIEKILEEKKTFDLTLSYEKQGNGEASAWTLPAPSEPEIVSSLPGAANLLSVSVEHIGYQAGEDGRGADQVQAIIASSADRKISVLGARYGIPLLTTLTPLDSPTLSCVVLKGGKRMVATSMSGLVVMYDLRTGRALDERRDHKKYVVKAAVWEEVETTWVATAGWDATVLLYRLDDEGKLGMPIASIMLQTNPEATLFVKDHDTGRLFLLISRRDSTSIYYYLIENSANSISSNSSTTPSITTLAGSQNLAPFSNAWIAFSPSSVSLCPTDATLVAVATSSIPHMKLLIVRLLFPPPAYSGTSAPTFTTQAEQTRTTLARQQCEEVAIHVNVNTMAPQTPYSTPQVCWRPDGCGVWVNGDDGVVRGVETKTGKIMTALKGGHEAGSKIRTIWAGWVSDEEERSEWIVSGGFDRRLVVWKTKRTL